MFFQIKSYFKFLLKSTNAHGIHSPFVFDLVTKCFYDKQTYQEYTVLEKYKSSLLLNKTDIDVTDFGAGSKVFKSNRRQVSKIAKNAGISFDDSKLLFRLVRYFKPQTILEIGTSLGLATTALASGNPQSKITSLEGCSETLNVAKNHLDEFGLGNVKCVNTEFEKFLLNVDAKYDLIYFDGNHTMEATLIYFRLLLPTVHNSTAWIFDDIHWSSEMEEAWNFIKVQPEVTVTIDCFQWGIVFFRNEQVKEHFTVRR